MGILISGAMLSSVPKEGKVFTVKRRKYEVVSHKSGKKPLSLSEKHGAHKTLPRQQEDIIFHVEAIKKLLAMIRRHAEVLEQQGFSVVLDKDKVVLQYK